MMATTKLFGDHMSIQLPTDIKDVSDLREVPDNQEVFVHPVTDQSLIIELLEYVAEADEQAVRTHYDDLTASNAVAPADSNITSLQQIPQNQLTMTQCAAAYLLSAEQKVAKYKETAQNTVEVHMALLRLPDQGTDILVCLNNPIAISPESSSHAEEPVHSNPWTLEQFKQAIFSLKILDIGLFG